MAQKKAKRSTRKSPVKRARKTVAKAATSTKRAASKAVKTTGKSLKKAAANPKRTVRKAADNVHQTAGKARDLGQNVVQAGELLTEAADFVDSLAQRAKARTQKRGQSSRQRP